jgi:TRAP-type C4-dicarboxylate transport system permease small subunit
MRAGPISPPPIDAARDMIRSVLTGLRRAERAAAGVLLVVIVALVVAASGARYAGAPILWALEVTQALFVWLCVLAADLTLQRLGHFSVDVVAKLLPRRARRALEIFNLLLVGASLSVLMFYGVRFASFTGMRPLPMTGVTSALATAALPAGFALMLITLAEHLVLRLRGRDLAPDAGAPREVM